MRVLAPLTAAVVLVLTSACSPGSSPVAAPGSAKIAVDTPALRAIKVKAGIEACRPGKAEPSAQLPDVTLPCLGGGEDVDLATLRGPMLVNIWAGYCSPCKKELPVLADFYRRYGDQVPVLGIDFQDPVNELAMKLAASSDVTYPQLADPDGDLLSTALMRQQALPTTALIDADGQVAFVQPIPLHSVDQIKQLVAEHLGVRL